VDTLRVKVPMTKGDAPPPDFLRLQARRRGILGRLTKRPVLRPVVVAGGTDAKLTVSDSLKLAIGAQPITVKEVEEKAYRWYRLSRSTGSLVAAAATVIGAGLLALGALSPKSGLGKSLLIAGGALSLVAVVAVVTSAWKAPIE
jgi:hypothetical protein